MHSDQQQHVRIPGKYKGVWDELDEGPEGAVWFTQDYTDLLRQVGEWRVIMTGGTIIYVLHTAFNSNAEAWCYTDVHEYLSLSELQ